MAKFTPAELKTAYKDVFGDNVSFAKGWSYRGRNWSYGVRGVVEHHTAGVGDGLIPYMLNKGSNFPRDGKYPFCNEFARRDGSLVVLSAKSAWHSGRGGPWSRYGVPKDLGHLMLWGREIESKGLNRDFTDEQMDTVHKADAALSELLGWKASDFKRIINHRGWTDGGYELGVTYYLPTKGRKVDTRYPATTFRNGARDASQIDTDPVPEEPTTAVSLFAVQKAALAHGYDEDVKVVATGMTKVGLTGFTETGTWANGKTQAYSEWQKRLGYSGTDADGIPGLVSLTALGKKSGLFVVKA